MNCNFIDDLPMLKNQDDKYMMRKLTPITEQINGYCVVVVQEETKDGKPGAFLGCLLRTPDSAENGPLLLLGEAIRKFKIFTLESNSQKLNALAADTMLPPTEN